MIDVICKEALYKLEKQDPENFNAARVDGDVIDKLIGKAHDSAVESLGGFLFEGEYKTPREELLDKISSIGNLNTEDQMKLLKEIEEAIDFVKKRKE